MIPARGLIVVGLLLAILIFDVIPRKDDYETLQGQLEVLKKQVALDLLFANKKEEISKQLELTVKLHQENEGRMYPGNIPTTTAMSQLQDTVQKILQQDRLEMLNIRWGEPIKEHTANYCILPLYFVAKGDPPDVIEFLRHILSSEKFLKAPVLTITQLGKENLSIDVMVYGYQMLSEGK